MVAIDFLKKEQSFYGNWFAFLANILTVLSNGYSIFADARATKSKRLISIHNITPLREQFLKRCSLSDY